MRMRLWIIVVLVIPILLGCAQTIKWDQEMYTEHKAAAVQSVATWSFNSGFYSCALAAQQVTFPTTIKNSAELQAFINNPTTTLGIAQLDQITRQLGKWSDEDYNLGCFQGTKTRMTLAEVIAGIKAFWPQAAPFMPSFK
jgi:hypothetical protein